MRAPGREQANLRVEGFVLEFDAGTGLYTRRGLALDSGPVPDSSRALALGSIQVDFGNFADPKEQ